MPPSSSHQVKIGKKSPSTASPVAAAAPTVAAAATTSPPHHKRVASDKLPTPRTKTSPKSGTPTSTAAATTTVSAQVVATSPVAHISHSSSRALPHLVHFTTLLGYAILMIFGYIREWFRKVVPDRERLASVAKPGYAPLVRDFDDFYTRRLYTRIRDCWNRPVNTRAGRVIGVMERVSKDFNKTFELTGKTIPAINLASYNYLGFSEDVPSITEDVLTALDRFGVAACASPAECGRSRILNELEQEIAEFVGKDAACVYAMGFATNFSGLPGLFDQDTLVISDSLNHASLVAGVRVSSGRVKVFSHGDINQLEKVIRDAIVEGRPRMNRAWKRIVLLVEGIYSMEGDIIDLPAIIALKKKYRCLLYIDEAHSIGALGLSGKGVCDYHSVNPADVDILMGTFTKSFGSIGGYIAGDKAIIDHLRRHSGASIHGDSLHSAACQQALSALRVMQGKDGSSIGKDRIRQLAENSRFFRDGLRRLGLTVFGDDSSPIIPVMLYNPAKMPAFSRECLKRNVAAVVVGYPATSLIESRVRFCISAAHTRADLEHCLEVIDEVASLVMVRYQAPQATHLWA